MALLLLQNGASLEVEDYENQNENFSLLHYACYQGNPTLVKMLIDKNLDVNAFSSSGLFKIKNQEFYDRLTFKLN